MITVHHAQFEDSRQLSGVDAESVDLVVTSPPYPMIDMWDEMFGRLNPDVAAALAGLDAGRAFELMHRELDQTWDQIFRVLKPGGMACINIGDAVRTVGDRFALYPNHARILSALTHTGLTALPAILWRKQTNAPNKFMGSGMLPPGAYATLEHEYILLFRKEPRRTFTTETQKRNRSASAFFWEERNIWFSDLWMDLKGTSQVLDEENARTRSAAFPFELPYRLINMFSVKGDTVLDPFAGMGTTMYAAMAAGRNSTMIEKDAALESALLSRTNRIVPEANARIISRLESHLHFVAARKLKGAALNYKNSFYDFPVVTRQEVRLVFDRLDKLEQAADGSLTIHYARMDL